MNLKCEMAKLDREALRTAVFAAVTYPKEFPAPDDHEVYKYHLARLLQRLQREMGQFLSGFWKLEFQKRGAAHYHLLITGYTGCILDFRDWLNQTWYDIVGHGDPLGLEAGVQADFAKSIRGAMGYLAKYISKEDQTMPGNFTGRYWGKFNAKNLPLSETETLDIEDESDCNKLSRWMRRIIEGHVMESRWRHAIKATGDWFNPDDGWTRLAVETALTGVKVRTISIKKKVRYWFSLDEGRTGEMTPPGTEIWSTHSGPGLLKIPKKFKLRGGSSVRLIADAAGIARAIMRGRAQGILSSVSPSETIPTPALRRDSSQGGDPAIVFGGFRTVSRGWDTPKRISGEGSLTDVPE